MHFSEIIKLQFEKERHTWLCILKPFTNIVHELSLKNSWLSPIFFFDLDLHFRHNQLNRGKNTFESVDTILNSLNEISGLFAFML